MSDQLVESRHQTITAKTDARNGQATPVLLTTETVTLDPETGTKNFTIINSMTQTVDGRLVKPDASNTCCSCGNTISNTATKACSVCTVTLCASCAGDPAYCTYHRWMDRLRRCWTWLTTL